MADEINSTDLLTKCCNVLSVNTTTYNEKTEKLVAAIETIDSHFAEYTKKLVELIEKLKGQMEQEKQVVKETKELNKTIKDGAKKEEKEGGTKKKGEATGGEPNWKLGVNKAARWGTILAGAIALSNNSLKPIDAMFHGLIKEEFDFMVNMREIGYVTQGITGEFVEAQEAFQQIGKTAKITGVDLTTFQEIYTKNLQRGVKTQIEMLSVTKSGLHTSTMVGDKANEIADTLSVWHMRMGLTSGQTAQLGRGIIGVAKETGVMGQNLANVVKSSEQIIETMRNVGTLTAGAATNVIRLMAAAEKRGVGRQMTELAEGASSLYKFLNETNPQMKNLLILIADASGKTMDLWNANLINTRENQRGIAEGLEKTVGNILQGVSLQNMNTEEITQEQNLALQTITGKTFGELKKMQEAAFESSKPFATKVQEIVDKLKLQNTTEKEALLLKKQLLDLEMSRGFEFINKFQEAADKSKDMNEALSKYSATMSKDKDMMEDLKKAGINTADSLEMAKGALTFGADKLKKAGGKDFTSAISKAIGSKDLKGIKTVMEEMSEEQQRLGIADKKNADPFSKIEQMTIEINEQLRHYFGGTLRRWSGFLAKFAYLTLLIAQLIVYAQGANFILGILKGGLPKLFSAFKGFGQTIMGWFGKITGWFGKKAVAGAAEEAGGGLLKVAEGAAPLAGQAIKNALPMGTPLAEEALAGVGTTVETAMAPTLAGIGTTVETAMAPTLAGIGTTVETAMAPTLAGIGTTVETAMAPTLVGIGTTVETAMAPVATSLVTVETAAASTTAAAATTGGVLAGLGATISAIAWPVAIVVAAILAVVSVIGSVIQGFKSFNKAAEIFNKKQEQLSMNEKLSAGYAGVLTGALNFLTFGIFSKWIGATGTITVALAKLIHFFGFLLWPLEALLGVLVGIYRFIKNVFIGIWDGIVAVVKPFIDALKEIYHIFADALSPIFDAFTTKGGEAVGVFEAIANVLGFIGKVIGGLFRAIGKVIGFIYKVLLTPLMWLVKAIAFVVKIIAKILAPIIKAVIGFFEDVYDLAMALLNFDFGTVGKVLYKMFVAPFVNVGKWLWDHTFGYFVGAGEWLWENTIGPLKNFGSWLYDHTIGALISMMPDWLKKWLGIKEEPKETAATTAEETPATARVMAAERIDMENQRWGLAATTGGLEPGGLERRRRRGARARGGTNIPTEGIEGAYARGLPYEEQLRIYGPAHRRPVRGTTNAAMAMAAERIDMERRGRPRVMPKEAAPVGIFGKILGALGKVLNILLIPLRAVIKVFRAFGTLIYKTLIFPFRILFAVFGSLFSILGKLITLDFKGVWTEIKAFPGKILSIFWDTFKALPGLIWTIFTAVPEMILEAFGLGNVFKKIKDTFIAGISALFGGIWDGIKSGFANLFGGIWKGIKLLVGGVWEGIKAIFEPILEVFIDLWDTVKEIFTEITGVFSDLWDTIKAIFEPILNLFGGAGGGGFVSTLKSIGSAIGSVISAIGTIIGTVFKVIGWILGTAAKIIGKTIGFVLKLILFPLRMLIKIIGFLVKALLFPIRLIIKIIGWFAKSIFHPVRLILGIFSLIGEGIGLLWNYVIKPAFELIGRGLGWAWAIISWPFKIMAQGIGIVWGLIKAGFQLVADGFSWGWGLVKAGFQLVADGLSWGWELIKTPFKLIGDGLNWVWDSLLKPVFERIKGAFDDFCNMIDGVINWIKDHIPGLGMVKKAAGFVGGIAKNVWNFFTGNKEEEPAPEQVAAADAQKEMAEQATTAGSLFVHDVVLEELLKNILSNQLMATQSTAAVAEKATEQAAITDGMSATFSGLRGLAKTAWNFVTGNRAAAAAPEQVTAAATQAASNMAERMPIPTIEPGNRTAKAGSVDDVYDRIRQEQSVAQSAVGPSLQTTKLETLNEEQVRHLTEINQNIATLVRLMKPSDVIHPGTGGAIPTATQNTPARSTDYARWQFGMQSSNPSTQGVNTGAT